MKKVFTLLMAITYLLLIIGVPISVHQCHGDSDWGLYVVDVNSCACSTDLHQEKHCSSHSSIQEHALENCSIDHHEMGCCTHEDKILNWSSDQQLMSYFKLSFKAISIALIYNNTIELIAPLKKEIQPYWAEAPPNRTHAVQILFQQFTFYG